MTPSSQDLAALLVRVEAAEGPDRELEAAIHMALFPDDFASKMMRGEYAVESWELGHGGISYVSLNSGGTSGGTQPVPHVTASLDSALALCARVLPGCLFAVCDLPQDNPAGHHMAGVRGPEVEEDAYGTTRALTILAALLRALLALAGDTSGGGGDSSSNASPSPLDAARRRSDLSAEPSAAVKP